MKTRWKKKKNFKLPTSKASFLCEKKKNLYGPEAPHQLSTLPGSTQLEGFCLCE